MRVILGSLFHVLYFDDVCFTMFVINDKNRFDLIIPASNQYIFNRNKIMYKYETIIQ